MKGLLMLATVFALLAGAFLFSRKNTETAQTTSPILSPSVIDAEVNFTASFTIKTDTITRSFTNPKYHNQSRDVYISSDDPTKVHVTKTGITWDDFFKTLPMKLTKDCLITGDGETLCSDAQGTLRFYLNDVEDRDLLDREIKQNDRALIKFTSL